MAVLPVMNLGVQLDILTEVTTKAGTSVRDFVIQSDAVLATLSVDAITGTLDVSVYAVVDDEESLVFSFPTIAAPVDLILKRSGPTTAHLRLRTSYTDPGTAYKVQCRAINSGSSDVKILGASGFSVSQQTVGVVPFLLIPSALVDRSGLVLKNWSGTQTVYIAETALKADPLVGYPLAPKDALAVDITAGAEVWAISDAAGADIRIGEAGG